MAPVYTACWVRQDVGLLDCKLIENGIANVPPPEPVIDCVCFSGIQSCCEFAVVAVGVQQGSVTKSVDQRRFSLRGSTTLTAAAIELDQALRIANPAVTDEEIQIIAALSRGERIIDIATQTGRSERSLYRTLKQTWKTLGVANTKEGIAAAARAEGRTWVRATSIQT